MIRMLSEEKMYDPLGETRRRKSKGNQMKDTGLTIPCKRGIDLPMYSNIKDKWVLSQIANGIKSAVARKKTRG